MATKPTPFPEYEEFMHYIRDSEVQEAFTFLVAAASAIPGYIGRPNPHGYISRNFHYFDNRGVSPFAFSVTQHWLLFYLRKPSQTHPSLSMEAAGHEFPDARMLADGQITFRIRSEDEARKAMLFVFGISANRDTYSFPDEVRADAPLIEGAVTSVSVNNYERNPRARAACIAHYGHRCSVCDLAFEELYGPIGRDFIHVHHVVEISSIRKEYVVDPVRDLRPVCANCHAMLHRSSPAMRIEDLKRNLTP